MFNTPPVFAIYVSYLTLQWIKQRGLAKIGSDNQQKADTLYTEIDRNSLFTGTVTKPEDRSQMNITFRCNNTNLEQSFLDLATQNNCIGIKGYRTVGGFRASIYNAMDLAGVQTLVQLMQHFEGQYA
jgi:phosphoserine aminotransferase